MDAPNQLNITPSRPSVLNPALELVSIGGRADPFLSGFTFANVGAVEASPSLSA